MTDLYAVMKNGDEMTYFRVTRLTPSYVTVLTGLGEIRHHRVKVYCYRDTLDGARWEVQEMSEQKTDTVRKLQGREPADRSGQVWRVTKPNTEAMWDHATVYLKYATDLEENPVMTLESVG